jgi:hypothetical protein
MCFRRKRFVSMPKKLNAKIPAQLYRRLRKEWRKNDAGHGVSFEEFIVKLLERAAAGVSR